MNRTIFASLTLALTLTACGDDKDTTTTSESAGSSSTADASTGNAATDGPATGDGTSTGTVDPNPTTGDVDPNTTTADPSTGTSVDPNPTEGPNTTTGAPDTGMESGGDIEMCLMMVDPGDACGECACNNCLAELHECQQDEGCTAIRMCAQEAMCSGIACLGPCGDTIDEYGGLGGPSAMKALALSGCVDDKCPGLCS